jgi:hypothetical protein
MYTKILLENLNGKGNWGDLGVDGPLINREF